MPNPTPARPPAHSVPPRGHEHGTEQMDAGGGIMIDVPVTPPKPKADLMTVVKEAKEKKTVDMSTSERLSKECVGVRLNISWFTTSKQVDKATKVKMATAAESTEQGFSASKRLMDSSHPVIKKANELRSRIQGAWKAHTIPFNAFGSISNGDGRRPEPGVRLISIDKYEAFHSLMQSFLPEVAAMQEEVNVNLPDIKELDRKRLGKTFNDEDYPGRINLAFSWGPVNVQVPAALEKLAPKAYQDATRRLGEQMEATKELAEQTLLQEMLAVVEAWTTALSPVVRIYPTENNQYHRFHGAEVTEILTREDDPQIEEGNKTVMIRYATGQGRATMPAELKNLTAAEYADLRPSNSMNEKKTFRDSTIEGMKQFLSQFRNVKGMIGDKPEMEAMVKQIESHLATLGTSKEIAKELRDSKTFRNETHKLMTNLKSSVVQQLDVVRRPTRRVTRLNLGE